MLMSNVVQVHNHQTEHETLAKPKGYNDYVQDFLKLKLCLHDDLYKLLLDNPITKLSQRLI